MTARGKERTRVAVRLVREPWEPAVADTLGRIQGTGMSVSNIHRLLANSPDVFGAFIGFAHALRHRTTLAPADRELAILRILELHRGDYELHHHRKMGLRAGLTQAQIHAVGAGLAAWDDLFDVKQIALLHFVDAFDAGDGIPEALAQRLHGVLDDRAMVELALTLALYMGLAHLTSTVELPLD